MDPSQNHDLTRNSDISFWFPVDRSDLSLLYSKEAIATDPSRWIAQSLGQVNRLQQVNRRRNSGSTEGLRKPKGGYSSEGRSDNRKPSRVKPKRCRPTPHLDYQFTQRWHLLPVSRSQGSSLWSPLSLLTTDHSISLLLLAPHKVINRADWRLAVNESRL